MSSQRSDNQYPTRGSAQSLMLTFVSISYPAHDISATLPPFRLSVDTGAYFRGVVENALREKRAEAVEHIDKQMNKTSSGSQNEQNMDNLELATDDEEENIFPLAWKD
ncbi:hypothetical protein CEP52_001920 [Fusarium oligoseptatum]|uniref:Uncharacterized protein n=1 Tax=Fusarium oligoseptatum TaxID=2604345 RepID=A0A428UGJ7_9HYPO|nr:hypothetical protein CEP52_001920 [Fusarium oligoseptatum]